MFFNMFIEKYEEFLSLLVTKIQIINIKRALLQVKSISYQLYKKKNYNTQVYLE